MGIGSAYGKYEKAMKKAKSAYGAGGRWECYQQSDKACGYIEKAYENGEITSSAYRKYKNEAEKLHSKVEKEMMDDGGIR